LNGHRNGKGRQIFYTEDENMDEDDYVEFEYIFEGEFLNDIRHGEGIFIIKIIF